LTPTSEEIAWAAGLFEGEGHLSQMRHRRRKDGATTVSLLAGLVSTDQDVVARFHAIVGVGNVTIRQPSNPRAKRQWIWQAAAVDDVRRVVRLFAPWLCTRRAARVAEVLAAYDASPAQRISKTHCPHGHEFTEDNTLRDAGGYRRCRECNRINQKRQTVRRQTQATGG
jgi:hypothetical protein